MFSLLNIFMFLCAKKYAHTKLIYVTFLGFLIHLYSLSLVQFFDAVLCLFRWIRVFLMMVWRDDCSQVLYRRRGSATYRVSMSPNARLVSIRQWYLVPSTLDAMVVFRIMKNKNHQTFYKPQRNNSVTCFFFINYGSWSLKWLGLMTEYIRIKSGG